ncbi:MAG: peptide chain release factor 1 [Candidatus Eremiobacteraeota bacterium]|nr:peptide chain release factor 1 [Candidatus Eremiobacteraeota bacterium]MBV9263438.1 peptide chain release factor 1 [Candidatus Eremiobacteraeota bacterium]
MNARLEAMARRFDEIDAQLANPSDVFDQARYTGLVKERAQLEAPVQTFRRLNETAEEIAANEALARDSEPELRDLVREENAALRARAESLRRELTELMMPRDPNDEKDVFVEIRAGAGGDEAAIFAGDLARMYMRFAEIAGMRVELASESPSEAGGYKEIVFAVKGKEPYRYLKHESGVHRVQRVPATEAQGRIHTSTATVAVLPQVDDDVEVEIKPAELQIDTYKASGAGGQYVNKTESAVRITHLPTGIVVASQQERSQQQNREKAMQMLRATIYDRKRREQEEEVTSLRRSQVGSGDRSEKIRTYNFPQDRVTDHRINRSFGNIRGVMDGSLGQIADELIADERARLMAGEGA